MKYKIGEWVKCTNKDTNKFELCQIIVYSSNRSYYYISTLKNSTLFSIKPADFSISECSNFKLDYEIYKNIYYWYVHESDLNKVTKPKCEICINK